jgi:hypothetical protein
MFIRHHLCPRSPSFALAIVAILVGLWFLSPLTMVRTDHDALHSVLAC